MRAAPALAALLLAGAGAAWTGFPPAPQVPAVRQAPTGDSVRAGRPSSAVVENGAPRVTLLYQNFPNPFPSAGIFVTCVWFDLARESRVDLQVADIRGNVVRVLLPRSDVPSVLPAGRHGPGAGAGDQGCDPRFTWDGRATSGAFVPPGVYLLRLRAAGVESYKKVLFRGR